MWEKIMKNLKPVWISFAAIILVSLASCNTTPPMPENTQISSDTVAETKSTQKIYLRHYGPGGPLWHLIDFELYSQIIDYILAKGGLPTQENIDSVYDSMRH
jgi:hypothetical protein